MKKLPTQLDLVSDLFLLFKGSGHSGEAHATAAVPQREDLRTHDPDHGTPAISEVHHEEEDHGDDPKGGVFGLQEPQGAHDTARHKHAASTPKQ